MDAVKDLLNLEIYTDKKKTIYKFIYTQIEITDLRMLKTVHKLKQVFQLMKTTTNEIHFLFIVNNMIIPTNFAVFQPFCEVFYENKKNIVEKLNFTIIQLNNKNIVNIFLWLFKQYYTPEKQLYISYSNDETKLFLHDKEYRKNNQQFEISNIQVSND